MAADASIYSLIQPARPTSPVEAYGGALQLQHLMDQSQLAGLQRKQLVEADQANQRIRDLFSRGTAPTEAEVLAADPATGLKYQQTLLANKKTQSEIDKNRLAGLRDTIDIFRNALGPVNDQNTYSAWRASLVKEVPQFAATVPEAFSVDSKRDLLMKADELGKQLTPNYVLQDLGGKKVSVDMNPITNPSIKGMNFEKTATPGELLTDKRAREQMAQAERHFKETQATPSLQHVETADGMYTFNTKTGKYEKAIGPDGLAIQGGKGLTESQGKATGLALRAQNAHDLLNKLESEGTLTPGIIKQGASGVPLIGGALEMGVNKLPTYLGGPNSAQQRVEQAQRDFVNAALRVESGANINKDEFENARKQYFPQPGDDKATIEQKRRNREIEIQSLKLQAGPGAKNVTSATSFANGPKPAISRDKLGGVLTQNADGSFNYGF